MTTHQIPWDTIPLDRKKYLRSEMFIFQGPRATDLRLAYWVLLNCRCRSCSKHRAARRRIETAQEERAWYSERQALRRNKVVVDAIVECC